MTNIIHIYKEGDLDCDFNLEIFSKLKKEYPDINVQEVLNESEEGKKLSEDLNISDFPATVVNGSVFATGAVNEDKLREVIGKNS